MLRTILKQLRRRRGYSIAVLTVAISFGLKLLLAQIIVHESPFLLFFLAVLISSIYGPRGAGLLATVLAAIVANYFFLSPFYSFQIDDLGQGIRLALFILEGGIICMLVTAMKSARQQAELNHLSVVQQQAIIQQTNAMLEQRIAERTEQLLESNTALNQQVDLQQQIEAALRQSEERLHLALEASGDGIWDWNIATGEVYFSPQWLTMLAYQPEEIPGHIDIWKQLLHPEDRPWVTEMLEAHLDDPCIPYRLDYRMLTQTGHWKWITSYGKVVATDAAGKPLRMIGTHRDISYRKLTEQALEESEASLNGFYNSAAMMMGIMELQDHDMCTISCNSALAQFLGTTPESAQHQMSADFNIPASLRQLWIDRLQACEQQGQPIHFEHRSIAPTGQDVWLAATVSKMAISAGGRSRFSCIIEDVTERKRIEQALQSSEARYRAIVQDQTELICRFQADGTLTFVNDAYCQYFGQQPQALIGTTFVPQIPPADQALVRQNLASLSLDQPTIGHQHQVILPNGAIRWHQWINRALFNDAGQITAVQAVGRDITDQKQAEANLEQSLQDKEVLLKEIHHRVKNNLQVISSLLSLQSRTLRNPDVTVQLQESQNRIRAMALVHEKLYTSTNFSQIKLYEYAKDLVKTLFRAYGQKAAHITPRLEIAPHLFLDINQAVPCGLILAELISNALKYAFTENKTGEILIQATEIDPDDLMLTIQDNGSGLPADINLVQPETLGLQLVRDLTDQLHGIVDIRRKCGTQVILRFPRSG
jgi:PAS domain S-box-containing protein